MATMYCALCKRPVEARRQIGAGTAILAFVTMGVSLLAIPFYAKRCSICKSPAVSDLPPDGAGAPTGRVAELERRLSAAETELESLNTQLDRVTSERDFYRQLLGDPAKRARDRLPPE